jgi:GTP-binding protein
MDFKDPKFVISVHHLNQLPDSDLPEIAFAGRSNVGKSSLINTILERKNLVKVSGRPGKTQGLNFFLVSECFHLVDLPGYGFAKVSKTMQAEWGTLIAAYLQSRKQLKCVVVIMDIRHEAKKQDSDLLNWLTISGIPVIGVYTKADKLSRSKMEKHARALDAGHGLNPDKRVLFSSKSGLGKDSLIDLLTHHIS